MVGVDIPSPFPLPDFHWFHCVSRLQGSILPCSLIVCPFLIEVRLPNLPHCRVSRQIFSLLFLSPQCQFQFNFMILILCFNFNLFPFQVQSSFLLFLLYGSAWPLISLPSFSALCMPSYSFLFAMLPIGALCRRASCNLLFRSFTVCRIGSPCNWSLRPSHLCVGDPVSITIQCLATMSWFLLCSCVRLFFFFDSVPRPYRPNVYRVFPSPRFCVTPIRTCDDVACRYEVCLFLADCCCDH